MSVYEADKNKDGCNHYSADMFVSFIFFLCVFFTFTSLGASFLLSIIATIIMGVLLANDKTSLFFGVICGFIWAFLIWDIVCDDMSLIPKIILFISFSIISVLIHVVLYKPSTNTHNTPVYNSQDLQSTMNIVRANAVAEFQAKYNEALDMQNTLTIQAQQLIIEKKINSFVEQYQVFLQTSQRQLDELNDRLMKFNNGHNDVEKNQYYRFASSCLSALIKTQTDFAQVYLYYRNNINSFNTANTSEAKTNIDTSLFNGCTDEDSLNKRYKTLIKTFHPDNPNGDDEMTAKINETYKYLKKQISN